MRFLPCKRSLAIIVALLAFSIAPPVKAEEVETRSHLWYSLGSASTGFGLLGLGWDTLKQDSRVFYGMGTTWTMIGEGYEGPYSDGETSFNYTGEITIIAGFKLNRHVGLHGTYKYLKGAEEDAYDWWTDYTGEHAWDPEYADSSYSNYNGVRGYGAGYGLTIFTKNTMVNLAYLPQVKFDAGLGGEYTSGYAIDYTGHRFKVSYVNLADVAYQSVLLNFNLRTW